MRKFIWRALRQKSESACWIISSDINEFWIRKYNFEMKLFESFLCFAISTGNPVDGGNENLIPLLRLKVNLFLRSFSISNLKIYFITVKIQIIISLGVWLLPSTTDSIDFYTLSRFKKCFSIIFFMLMHKIGFIFRFLCTFS